MTPAAGLAIYPRPPDPRESLTENGEGGRVNLLSNETRPTFCHVFIAPKALHWLQTMELAPHAGEEAEWRRLIA